MTSKSAIALFGGTFDPVHFGHLRTAKALCHQLPVETVRLIPCRQPVHRPDALASSRHRLAMLHLAVENTPELCVDDREICRDTPSYTLDTLKSLRAENPESPLGLAMGTDVFAGFASWHAWADIPGLAHLVVINRPGIAPTHVAPIAHRIHAIPTDDPAALSTRLSGYIFFLTLPAIPISATQIRTGLAEGQAPTDLLPVAVWQYIKTHGLYGRAKDKPQGKRI